MNIGEKIKKLRLERNISQAKLGEIIGVHEKHISRYERGISHPSAEILKKMAGFFEVSIDFLLKDDSSIHDNLNNSNNLLEYFEEANRLGEEDKHVIKGVLEAIIYKAKMQRPRNKT